MYLLLQRRKSDLNQRFNQACGNVKSFKRLITPANKPQGFGFAEFEEPDSALRCMTLLNGIELPAFEEGAANKKLLVRDFTCLLILTVFTFDGLGQGGRKNKGLLGRLFDPANAY